MNAHVVTQHGRTRCEGMLQILRYNRSQYALAGACVAAACIAMLLALPGIVRGLLGIGAAAAAYWTLASLLASHYIYDRSGLLAWTWLARLLPRRPQRWVNVHCGLDYIGDALHRLFPNAIGRTFDIYDWREMTEPSISRARALATVCPGATPADASALPVPDGACDMVFVAFAAHELRSPTARVRFFRELRRSLAHDGFVVLIEHLRDAPNFLAFGPGFLHFLGRNEWLRVARAAGFEVSAERRVTPFVRCMLLRRAPWTRVCI